MSRPLLQILVTHFSANSTPRTRTTSSVVATWINIKFCVKIGKSASKTLVLLRVAYGEYAMK
jgi:hypothetical protein